MSADPIRARLARIELGCSVFGEPQEMVDALHAVLDLCDDGEGTTRYEMAQVSVIRRVIAEHLGVTDVG